MNLTKITKPKKHIPEALQNRSIFSLIGRDPYIDWVGSLLVVTIITLMFVAVGVISYWSVTGRISTPVSKVKPIGNVSLDTKTLDKIVSEFDKRAEIRKSLIQGYSGYGDPSL